MSQRIFEHLSLAQKIHSSLNFHGIEIRCHYYTFPLWKVDELSISYWNFVCNYIFWWLICSNRMLIIHLCVKYKQNWQGFRPIISRLRHLFLQKEKYPNIWNNSNFWSYFKFCFILCCQLFNSFFKNSWISDEKYRNWKLKQNNSHWIWCDMRTIKWVWIFKCSKFYEISIFHNSHKHESYWSASFLRCCNIEKWNPLLL